MTDELTWTLEWVVDAFDDNAVLIWSIISGPAIACLASVYRLRAYVGWARDRFGIVIALRSTLGQLVRFDRAAYVPSRFGYVAVRPGTADLDVYDEVLGRDAYRIDLDPAPKLLDLGLHRHSAVDHRRAERDGPAVGVDALVDLDRELAGRNEDQRPDRVAGR